MCWHLATLPSITFPSLNVAQEPAWGIRVSAEAVWQLPLPAGKNFSIPVYGKYQHICIKTTVSKVKSSETCGYTRL